MSIETKLNEMNEQSTHKFVVQYYHYEFNTNEDDRWSQSDVLDTFNNEPTKDPYCIDPFDTYEDARLSVELYMGEHAIAPMKQQTVNGWVVRGEILEIVETVDGDPINSELFTRGER